MPWFAVRTRPGAQMPKRQFVMEKTKGPKGYRFVSIIDENTSAVELALSDAGFVHYMPAEKRLIRDRRRPMLWKHRRFALMVGYVFVHSEGPLDFARLRAVPGVAGILCGGDDQPLEVPLVEIVYVRTAEAKSEAKFDEASRAARQQLRRAAKVDPGLERIVAKLDVAGTVTVRPEEVDDASSRSSPRQARVR